MTMSQENVEIVREVFEAFRFHPEGFWDLGESVVVEIRLTANGRQTTIPVEQRSAGLWTIREGKVMHVRAFPSAEDALAAAGLEQ
jgi:ketosteroid isomerase-like protein